MSIHQCTGVKITFDNLPSTQPCADRIYPNQASERFPTDSDLNLYPIERFCDPNYKPTNPLDGRFDPWNGTNDAEHNSRIFSVSSSEFAKEYGKNLDQINDVIKNQVAHMSNSPETSETDDELNRAAESTRNYQKQYSESLRQKNSKKFYKAVDGDKATTQLAKETGMSDAQVYDTIKENEESVAGDKKVVWVSAVIADEIQHRIENLKNAFTSMVESESGCFTDRDKVKITDKCDALIAVDPIMLELFIKAFKHDAKRSEDLIACIPEKPVEVPTHHEPNVTSGHRVSEPASGKAGGDAVDAIASEDTAVQTAGEQAVQTAKKKSLEEWNKTFGDPNASEFKVKNEDPIEWNPWEKAKLKYDCGEFKLTPDGDDSVLKGHTPVLDAWHVGQDPLGPTVTPEQWFNNVKAIEDANKSVKIPGATPHDPSKVNWFTDDNKRLQTAESTPTPITKSTAWTADGHPFDCGHNYGRSEQAKVEKKAPLIPKVYDVPKDLVEMVEKLPNDIWKYEANQNDDGLVLTLTYDVEPRHISITVNTHAEEVIISTKKDFRGSYNTTLDWSAETAADESIPNTRRLFAWLRQWIKDIME